MTSKVSILFNRAISALPDTVTGCVFLLLWIHPLYFGPKAVGNGMLVMIMEFILIHATIMLPAMIVIIASRFGKTVTGGVAAAGAIAFYFLFVGALSFAFRQWWPVVVFAWLLFGKSILLLLNRGSSGGAGGNIGAVWLISVLAWLGGAFFTTLMPLPRFGFADIPRSDLDLPLNASGIWMEQPHGAMAFGMLYFFVLAFAKWRLYDPTKPAPKRELRRAGTID